MQDFCCIRSRGLHNFCGIKSRRLQYFCGIRPRRLPNFCGIRSGGHRISAALDHVRSIFANNFSKPKKYMTFFYLQIAFVKTQEFNIFTIFKNSPILRLKIFVRKRFLEKQKRLGKS